MVLKEFTIGIDSIFSFKILILYVSFDIYEIILKLFIHINKKLLTQSKS